VRDSREMIHLLKNSGRILSMGRKELGVDGREGFKVKDKDKRLRWKG
jgi:hypothetical protein